MSSRDGHASELTDSQLGVEEFPRPRDWLWRPWYAKLWWAAIPLYWLPAAAPFKVKFLSDFYAGGAAHYLNIVFLPITALVVLGFGFARKCRDCGYWDDDYEVKNVRASAFYKRTPGSPPAFMDAQSPLSGSFWVGSARYRAKR